MAAWASWSDTETARATLICMLSYKAWWFGWKLKSCISIRSAFLCGIVKFYGTNPDTEQKIPKMMYFRFCVRVGVCKIRRKHSVNSVASVREPLHCLHSVFLL